MAASPFCPQCGKQFVPEANFCSACGSYALPAPPAYPLRSQIVRPRSPRMVAGVCSGVAIHFGWDVALVRILFAVFLCFTLMTGLLVYLAAWVLLPDAQFALPTPTGTIAGQVVAQHVGSRQVIPQ